MIYHLGQILNYLEKYRVGLKYLIYTFACFEQIWWINEKIMYKSSRNSIFLIVCLHIKGGAYVRVFLYNKKKHSGQILYLCFYLKNYKIWPYVNCCGLVGKKLKKLIGIYSYF